MQRDERQRRALYDKDGVFIDPDGLLGSVRARGVINPIIVNREFVLVAGERRLEASRCAQRADIPVRFVEDLSETEAKIIELEENIKRADLPWRDEVNAVATLHKLYKDAKPDHTISDTVRELGYSQVAECLRVARDINSPRISSATSCRQAYNTLTRLDERGTADAINDIIDAGAAVFGGTAPVGAENATHASDGASGITGTAGPNAHHGAAPGQPAYTIPPAAPSDSIIHETFEAWAEQYTGPSFNFIHCDFPYGISVFAGPQSGKQSQIIYDDSREAYEHLIEVLCKHLPRLMAHSAHFMFWLTADIETQAKTLLTFRRLAPSLLFWPKPLIWHKTDNIGILSDPKRGPRHVYETALIASQEDRLIVKAVSDTYGAPTDKSHHPSTKPEPVLRHFFQMFVDEHSRVLDPTCGSGSALRAAESLGAKSVLGIEKDEEYYKSAQSALRTFRTLRSISK